MIQWNKRKKCGNRKPIMNDNQVATLKSWIDEDYSRSL